MFPLQGDQVQSLVGKLGSFMPYSVAPKKMLVKIITTLFCRVFVKTKLNIAKD